MTEDNSQADGIMCVMQALMEAGMLRMIMYVATHNTKLSVTPELSIIVLK